MKKCVSSYNIRHVNNKEYIPVQLYRENPNNQTTPYEQALGDSGKEKLPFNRTRLREGQPSAVTGWRWAHRLITHH